MTLKLYTPHEKQLEIHNSKARFNVAAFGRQAGKTTYGQNKITKMGWEKEGIYWFIEPTYKQAKVVWRRMEKAFKRASNAIIRDYNKTDLFFQLLSGSYVFCQSGEVLDNLRIETLHGAVIDEVRNQHASLWPMVIRPMLSTTQGWADFLSTPNGYDSFYDIAEMAKINPDWAFFHAPSTANPLFTQQEFESAKRDMTEAQFAQEILAEFRNLSAGSAYKTFGSHNWVDVNPFAPAGAKWSKYMPIIVGLDFNVNPMSWILGQHKQGHGIYFGEEIYLENTYTQEAALELVSRVKDHKAGLILIGDATGKSKSTKSAGQSDYDILCEILAANRIKFENFTPTENPLVKDRVNTVCARLKSADGTVSIWVNRKECPHLVKDFERVTWKEGAQAILDKTTDTTLTHMSDAAGYPVCVLMPLQGVREVGGLLHIPR